MEIDDLIRRLREEDFTISPRMEAADVLTTLQAERDALRERVKVLEGALDEADMGITALERYADRAWAGEVDAGGRELSRQVHCKFEDYRKARAALKDADT